MNHQIVAWRWADHKWDLMVQRTPKSKPRSVATAYMNGTWYTWDHDGVGGENAKEETVKQAKLEAAGSAINQGFI
jgi:hypothetical protein